MSTTGFWGLNACSLKVLEQSLNFIFTNQWEIWQNQSNQVIFECRSWIIRRLCRLVTEQSAHQNWTVEHYFKQLLKTLLFSWCCGTLWLWLICKNYTYLPSYKYFAPINETKFTLSYILWYYSNWSIACIWVDWLCFVVWSRHNWRRCPWKAREAGAILPLAKMRVPLSICHPAVISVLIHNR